MTTDKFIILYKTTLDFVAAENNQNIPVTYLLYEFETGQTSELSILNAELSMLNWYPPRDVHTSEKNMVADFITVSRLKKAYEDKQLKGELEKFAATLDDEEDNPIVRIIKFK